MRCIVLVLLCAGIAHADLPSPRLDRLLPSGGAAGGTVEVEISGPDLDEPKQLLFDHPGIKAEFLKDKTFRVQIAPTVPAGTYDARFVGKYGLSNPRIFAVSRGLTEIREKGPNDAADLAMVVPVNVVINGATDGNREDFYRFPAKKGQRIALDCQAARLESPLDGTMTLFTSDGKQLATSGDYHGRDPFIDFLAPADGEYILSVYDLSYRGGNFYRLSISDQPSVENVFPRVVTHGKSVDVMLLGRNLGAGSKPSPWKLDQLPLDERKLTITPPTDILATRRFAFFEHPTDYSVLPTAVSARLTGFQLQPFDSGSNRATTMMVTDGPVTLDAEPNDKPEQGQPITLPAVVAGRFDKERDADWFTFECSADGTYVMRVFCEQIGGRADPYIVVTDENGQRLGEQDDYGHRQNAFDGHLRDPFGTINLNAKKKYRLLVQDRYRRGGPRYQYVMTFAKQEPDFHVGCIHSANPSPLATNLWRGGAVWLDVIIHQEGYNGPITLTAEKLPPGVHAQPTVIHNNSRGAFVLWADENVAESFGPIELVATGKDGDRVLKRVVKPFTRVQGEQSSRPMREQYIGVSGKAPFALSFAPEKVTIEQGKKAEVKVNLQRLWPEFTGKVNLQPLLTPNNVKSINAEIGDGKNEMTLSIEVNANATPGEHTLAMMAQGQVPYQKDAKSPKGNQLVTLPTRPLVIEITAAKK